MTIPGFESAHDWNRRHPPGTAVHIVLSNGESFTATTAVYATQWGSLAVLALRERPGLWTVGALKPVRTA